MTHISHITLFTTALCNLNCNYCYICKDVEGGLNQIDKDLENDFKNNIQIQQILDYDPETSKNVNGITLWGGEPFLHIDRFLDNIQDYFIAFPNLNKIDTSTNFTIANQVEKIEKLLCLIDKYYQGKDKFILDLQISIDGYEEMNDYGRGKGVTQKFLNNFYELINLTYNSDKIIVTCHTKPTLSKQTFKFLDSEEKIFKWFDFFNKKMYLPYISSNSLINFQLSLWNCAQPTEWTSEDGKEYAKIAQTIAKISSKIKSECAAWRDHISLVPEAFLITDQLRKIDIDQISNNLKRPTCGGGCGSFIYNIVPIPNGLFTMCHRGLFDAYVDYANNFQNKDFMNNLSKEFFKAKNTHDWIYTKENLKKMEQTMSSFDCYAHQIRYTDLIVSIREYAIAGIIDEKYKDEEIISKTLGYFLFNSYCLQDAYIFSGSWTTASMQEVPLMYNGVMDVVLQEIDRVRIEKGWKIE